MRALVLTSVVVLLAGCDDEPPPAPPPVAVAKRKVEEAPVVEAVAQADYVYNPVGKRDPFRGYLIEGGGPRSGPSADPVETAVCTDPLCLIDLEELKVVAVVSGDANPMAMVEDRSGVGHIVRRNTKIGRAGGKVTQVLRECFVVTSFVSGGADGKPVAKKDELCVSTADNRSQPALDLLQNKEYSP